MIFWKRNLVSREGRQNVTLNSWKSFLLPKKISNDQIHFRDMKEEPHIWNQQNLTLNLYQFTTPKFERTSRSTIANWNILLFDFFLWSSDHSWLERLDDFFISWLICDDLPCFGRILSLKKSMLSLKTTEFRHFYFIFFLRCEDARIVVWFNHFICYWLRQSITYLR